MSTDRIYPSAPKVFGDVKELALSKNSSTSLVISNPCLIFRSGNRCVPPPSFTYIRVSTYTVLLNSDKTLIPELLQVATIRNSQASRCQARLSQAESSLRFSSLGRAKESLGGREQNYNRERRKTKLKACHLPPSRKALILPSAP